MAKPKVYIETTIISYLTAWRSAELLMAARQQSTRDWWDTQRPKFDIFTSELVLLEAGAGDPRAAAARLQVLSNLVTLFVGAEAKQLAELLISARAVPMAASRDALHIGIAATSGMTFLLTWNFTHLANASQRDRISHTCRAAGFEPPVICTPDELHEET
jgi:hypothetical protein